MRDDKTSAVRLLQSLSTETSRAELASVFREAEQNSSVELSDDVYARISCHLSDDVRTKLSEFVQQRLDFLGFPAPLTADETAGTLAALLSGFDADAFYGETGDVLFGKCLIFLEQRLINNTEDIRDSFDIGYCVLDDGLEVRRVDTVTCHIPDNVVIEANPDLRKDARDKESWIAWQRDATYCPRWLCEVWDDDDSSESAESRFWQRPVWQGSGGSALYLLPQIYSLYPSPQANPLNETENNGREAVVVLAGEFSEKARKANMAEFRQIVPALLEIIASFCTARERRVRVPNIHDWLVEERRCESTVTPDLLDGPLFPSFKAFHSDDARSTLAAGIDVRNGDAIDDSRNVSTTVRQLFNVR